MAQQTNKRFYRGYVKVVIQELKIKDGKGTSTVEDVTLNGFVLQGVSAEAVYRKLLEQLEENKAKIK